MIENIGENGIEMFCDKDKIIIYENMNKILRCPICNDQYFYCPYCKRAEKKKTCCTRGYIKNTINNGLNAYININDDEDKKIEFIQEFIFILIPFLFNFSLFFTIFTIFYLGLIKNDAFFDDKISNEKLDFFRKILIVCFIFLMSIVYFTFFYSLLIFTIIFSIPFKLYPIKCYLGIIDEINSK